MIHPLFQVMDRLFATSPPPAALLPKPQVTISIPKSHPAALKIMEAATRLANVTRLESGIVIEKHVPPDYAEEELLKVLREALGSEVVSHALQQVALQQQEYEAKRKLLSWSKTMRDPLRQGQLVVEAAKLGAFQEQLSGPEASDLTRFLNKAEAQRDGRGQVMDTAVATAAADDLRGQAK